MLNRTLGLIGFTLLTLTLATQATSAPRFTEGLTPEQKELVVSAANATWAPAWRDRQVCLRATAVTCNTTEIECTLSFVMGGCTLQPVLSKQTDEDPLVRFSFDLNRVHHATCSLKHASNIDDLLVLHPKLNTRFERALNLCIENILREANALHR